MKGINFHQQEGDIKHFLDEANELGNQVWRFWRYTKEHQTLVLCGYNLPFEITAFVILRDVTKICISQWLEKARFDLVNESNNKFPSQQVDLKKSEHLIIVTTEESFQHQYIVCKEIMYIPI